MNGVMCRTAYNGNCNLKCQHSMQHRRNEECKLFCRRMNVITICIDVESNGWDLDTVVSQCGKRITADCQED